MFFLLIAVFTVGLNWRIVLNNSSNWIFSKIVVDEKNCEEEGEEIADITEEEAE